MSRFGIALLCFVSTSSFLGDSHQSYPDTAYGRLVEKIDSAKERCPGIQFSVSYRDERGVLSNNISAEKLRQDITVSYHLGDNTTINEEVYTLIIDAAANTCAIRMGFDGNSRPSILSSLLNR